MSNKEISAVSRCKKLEEYARQLRSQEQFQLAAEFYTASAHAYFSFRRRLQEERSEDRDAATNSPLSVASGVRNLLAAALCYRIAGADDRARTGCEIGIQTVTDVAANESRFVDRPARRGLAQEWVGDLRLFGDIGDPDAEYRRATPHYEAVESPNGWLAEPEFENTLLGLFDLADSVGDPVPADRRDATLRKSLVDRIELKRDQYSDIVSDVLEQASWQSSLF